ncbi:MAG: EAL domain-containing protein [Pseudomonadota bacterium]
MGAHAVRLSNVDIDNALKNRDFEVLFQPIFDLSNGALARMESFVRWRHPSLGILPPGAFISFFETQGRMSELTRYVLGEALDGYLSWRGAFEPGFSINLALSDLTDEAFVGHFSVLLRERKFPAELITLECPMPPVDADTDAAMASFERLAETGARLAIEVRGRANDFLRNADPFPFAEIKTGGAAILRFARTVRGPGLSAISELLDIANTNNAAITAVGVEDQASLSALKGLGFVAAQGNHLGKVGPLTQFTPSRVNEVRALLELDPLEKSDLAALFRTETPDLPQLKTADSQSLSDENSANGSVSASKPGESAKDANTSETRNPDDGNSAPKSVATRKPTQRRVRTKSAAPLEGDVVDRLNARIRQQQASNAMAASDDKLKSRKAAAISRMRSKSDAEGAAPSEVTSPIDPANPDETPGRAETSAVKETPTPETTLSPEAIEDASQSAATETSAIREPTPPVEEAKRQPVIANEPKRLDPRNLQEALSKEFEAFAQSDAEDNQNFGLSADESTPTSEAFNLDAVLRDTASQSLTDQEASAVGTGKADQHATSPLTEGQETGSSGQNGEPRETGDHAQATFLSSFEDQAGPQSDHSTQEEASEKQEAKASIAEGTISAVQQDEPVAIEDDNEVDAAIAPAADNATKASAEDTATLEGEPETQTPADPASTVDTGPMPTEAALFEFDDPQRDDTQRDAVETSRSVPTEPEGASAGVTQENDDTADGNSKNLADEAVKDGRVMVVDELSAAKAPTDETQIGQDKASTDEKSEPTLTPNSTSGFNAPNFDVPAGSDASIANAGFSGPMGASRSAVGRQTGARSSTARPNLFVHLSAPDDMLGARFRPPIRVTTPVGAADHEGPAEPLHDQAKAEAVTPTQMPEKVGEFGQEPPRQPEQPQEKTSTDEAVPARHDEINIQDLSADDPDKEPRPVFGKRKPQDQDVDVQGDLLSPDADDFVADDPGTDVEETPTKDGNDTPDSETDALFGPIEAEDTKEETSDTDDGTAIDTPQRGRQRRAPSQNFLKRRYKVPFRIHRGIPPWKHFWPKPVRRWMKERSQQDAA